MAAARQRGDDRGGRGGRSSRRRLDARRSVRPGFSHEKALILGVIQVLAGIAALILGVVSISTRAWGYYYAAGFWSGTLFFVSGVFGLTSARRKSNCSIVAFMVFSAMSAILALVTLTLSAIGVATENVLFHQHQQQRQGEGAEQLGQQSNALAVHSLIIVVSTIAAVCGTAASIVGCRAVCGVWYLPDNPYHSAADLQTPTSGTAAEFTSGYRQNSNLQYLIDPDLRAQAQHLFSADGDAGRGTASICPPASYEFPTPMVAPPPPPALPPPSGPQQIAILAPAADGSVYGMVQASSDQAGGISQVMYIMPNTGPCPQPGIISEGFPDPPATPPPSYSQINLTEVGLDDSTDSRPSYSSQDVHNSSGSADYSVASAGRDHRPGELTFPTQLPPLDRLMPLSLTRSPAPPRPHRGSSSLSSSTSGGQQHRPTSMPSSRTSGTQTCLNVASSSTTPSTAPSASHSQSGRHRPTSQRHSTVVDAHHRDTCHRRPTSGDCRGGGGGGAEGGAIGVTCHRHSQSVGTQAGPQSRSSSSGGTGSSNSRSATSRHHSSRSNSSSSAGGGGGGGGGGSSNGGARSSRPSRDRHRVPGSEQQAPHDLDHVTTDAVSGSGVSSSRSSSHLHHPRPPTGGPTPPHWRHSGSYSPVTIPTSQELAMTSPVMGMTSSSNDVTSDPRRWPAPSYPPPQYVAEQSSTLSALNSVL